jgi:hypothetical protein
MNVITTSDVGVDTLDMPFDHYSHYLCKTAKSG